MRFGILGRTEILLESARQLIAQGHTLTFVATASSPSYCGTSAEAFAELADEHNVPFVLASSLYNEIESIRASHTDIAVSVNWPNLLKEPLLSLFPHGILNAHAGDLPRYRGNAVANWAILSGESQIGLTIHRMSTELDAGPILRKEYLSLSATTYISDVMSWLELTIPTAFASTLKEISNGTTRPIEQSATGLRPLRAYPRKPEDSRINWLKSSAEILRLIRASSRPFAGAFAFTEQDQLVRIWRAEIQDPEFDVLAIPGQVCFSSHGDPVIACGDGMLRLTEVTDENGHDARPMILSSLRNRLL